MAEGDGGTISGAMVLRLRVLQLRLWFETLLENAVRGLCFGLALALGGALALITQADVVDRSSLLLPVVAGLAVGALWGILRPPSLLRAARTADSRLHLEARLGTAVELLSRSERGKQRPYGQLRGGRLDGLQAADAAMALRSARGRWPLPLVTAWRESVLAGMMALALLAALQLEGQGANLFDMLPLPQQNGLLEFGERQSLAKAAAASSVARSERAASPAGPVLRTLDELRRAREAGSVGPGQADAVLDQVESELNQMSAGAQQQRETMERLARALSQVSASEWAAEAIRRGDYAEAAQQLAQFGQESDQLSAEARRQLAQALRRAAAESTANPRLADRERRAAEALGGRDYEATRSALGSLGEELAQSGGLVATQGELAEAMQRLLQERGSTNAGPPASSAAAGVSPSGSPQSGGSRPGSSEGGSREGGSAQAEAPATGQSGHPALAEGAGQRAAGGIEPGAPRLDVAGKQVEVAVRPGSEAERGNQTERSGGEEQIMDVADTSHQPESGGATVAAGGQAERVVVPAGQRQVVRDYFGKRGGRRSP